MPGDVHDPERLAGRQDFTRQADARSESSLLGDLAKGREAGRVVEVPNAIRLQFPGTVLRHDVGMANRPAGVSTNFIDADLQSRLQALRLVGRDRNPLQKLHQGTLLSQPGVNLQCLVSRLHQFQVGCGQVLAVQFQFGPGPFVGQQQAVKALGQRAKDEQAGENENDQRNHEHDGRDRSDRFTPRVGFGGKLLHDLVHAHDKGILASEQALDRTFEPRLELRIAPWLFVCREHLADGAMDVGPVRFELGKQFLNRSAVMAGQPECGVALLQSLMCCVPKLEILAEIVQQEKPLGPVRGLAQEQNQVDQSLAEHPLPAGQIDDMAGAGTFADRVLDEDLADDGQESNESQSEEIAPGQVPKPGFRFRLRVDVGSHGGQPR